MRLTNLTRFPGIPHSALLGDICLVAGDPAEGATIYEEAWRQGDRDALVGWSVLADRPSPGWVGERLEEMIEHLGRGRVEGVTARKLARLLLLPLLLEMEGVEAASLALSTTSRFSGLSLPHLSLTALAGARDAREALVRDVLLWDEQHATDHGLGLALLRAAFVEPIHREGPPLGMSMLGRLGPICGLYTAIRVVDRAGTGATFSEEVERQALEYLSLRAAEVREVAIYQKWRLPSLRRQGLWEDARELVETLAMIEEASWSDELHAERQRLAVMAGNFGLAGHLAAERAERCRDPQLRAALMLLTLEYLRRDGASEAAVGELSWRVLDETPGEVTTPPLQHLLEVLEGAYLESQQFDRLLELWKSSGALDVEEQSVETVWHTPPRSVEHALLCARGVMIGQPVMVDPVVHRYELVRRLASQDLAGAAQLLDQSADRWTPHDKVLSSALHIADDGGPEPLNAARDLLEAQVQSAGAELLPTLLLREVFTRQGRRERADEVLSRVTSRQPTSVQAAVQATLAREHLDAEDVDLALAAARSAFQLDTLSGEVRSLYRRVAEMAGEEEDLRQIAFVIDDQELDRRLSSSDSHASLFEDVKRLASGPEGQQKLALTKLQWLSRQIEDRPLRAALLRYGAELAWRGVGDLERAARMAREAMRWAPEDQLSARVALELLIAQGRFAEVADILLSPKATPPLPPDRALMLLEGARALKERDDRRRALALCRQTLELLPLHVAGDELLEALDMLEALYLSRKDFRSLRDDLEGLLLQHTGQRVAAELNRRLGQVYQAHLGDRDLAIEHFRRSLEHGPAHTETLEALEVLYREAHRLHDLAEVLRHRIETAAHSQAPGARDRRVHWLRTLGDILGDELGDLEGAREVYGVLASEVPSDLDVWLKLGWINRQLGRMGDVVEALEQAAALMQEPRERSRLLMDLGEVLAEEVGDAEGALEAYEQSFACDPHNVETFRRLERLYQQMGRWESLLEVINAAIDATTEGGRSEYDREHLYARKAHVELNMMERPSDAVDSLLSALRSNPQEERHLRELEAVLEQGQAPRALVVAYRLRLDVLPRTSQERLELLHRVADLHLQLGEEAEAIAIYQTILTGWPSDLSAAQRLEGAYKSAERWGELLDFYQSRLQVVDSADAAVPLYMAIARVAERKMRDFELAIDTYEKLLQLVPGQMAVLRSMGRLLEATRQWDRLLEVSEREVKLTDTAKARAHVYFRIGTIHETARGDLPSAISAYEAAVSHEPSYVPAIHGLREIYKRQERWDQVIATLQREANLWGEPKEQASIFTRVAEVYWENLEAPQEAELYLNEALNLVEAFPSAMRGLLNIYVAQQRWNEADPLALQLSQMSESFTTEQRSDLFWKRAVVARELGNTGEAVAALQIALDIDPHNNDAFEAMLSWAEEAAEAGAAPDAEYTEFLERFDQILVEHGDTARRVRLTAHWGRLAEAMLQVDRARSRYEEATTLQPDSIEAHRPLASFLMRFRRFDEVGAIWEALLRRLSQAGVEARRDRVEVLVELADLHTDWLDDPEQGIALYEDALRLDPTNLDTLYKAAQCNYMLERWDEAHQTMTTVLDLLDEGEGEDEEGSEQERGRLAEYVFYLGRILEAGLNDEERALSHYRRARRLNSRDIRPVLAAGYILFRAGNWIRLENMVRGAAEAVANTVSPQAAMPLRMFLANAFSKVRDYAKAEEELRGLLESGDLGERAASVHFALVELYGRMSNGVPKALKELHLILDLDPMNVQALHTMGQMYQAIRQHDKVYICYDALTSFGVATPQESRFIAECRRQRIEWAEPPSQELQSEHVERHVMPEALQSAERRGFARLGATLSHLHSNEGLPFRPLLDRVDWVREVHAEVAGLFGVKRFANRVIPVALGPTGMSLRYVAGEVEGSRRAQTRALVPVDAEAPRTPHHEAALRFMLGHAMGQLSLKLMALRAMPLDVVSRMIEVMVRVQLGEELEALGAVPHLGQTVQDVVEYDGGRALRSAVVQMRKSGLEAPVHSEAEAYQRANRLLEGLETVADRFGLLACGSMSRAVDTLVAVESGQDVHPLGEGERRGYAESSLRIRRLLCYNVSRHHFSLRLHLGYDTAAIVLPRG